MLDFGSVPSAPLSLDAKSARARRRRSLNVGRWNGMFVTYENGKREPPAAGWSERGAFTLTQQAPLSWPATAGHPGDACSYRGRNNSEQTWSRCAEPNWVARSRGP